MTVNFPPFLRRKKLSSSLALLAAALLLSGVSAANTDNVDYSKFELDSPVSDMMWCGPQNEVILVLSEQGTVYRSRDRGSQWRKLQQVMQ
jgi:photosystem II stability/assembly factor-like uncharacterized protein